MFGRDNYYNSTSDKLHKNIMQTIKEIKNKVYHLKAINKAMVYVSRFIVIKCIICHFSYCFLIIAVLFFTVKHFTRGRF
jgi:hypothetical protein